MLSQYLYHQPDEGYAMREASNKAFTNSRELISTPFSLLVISYSIVSLLIIDCIIFSEIYVSVS